MSCSVPIRTTLTWSCTTSRGASSFPKELTLRSELPHFKLLGSPFGDAAFCGEYVTKLCVANEKLLARIEKLEDPQVALHLFRSCAGFGKFVYVARTTPPHLIQGSLARCDEALRTSFASATALQVTDRAWAQAQLSLSRGGLGFRSVAEHCAAAFVSSHIRCFARRDD